MLVKICGITTVEDAGYAVGAGADWVGLNLVAGPRRIGLSQAGRILDGLDDRSRVVALLRIQQERIPDARITALRGRGVQRLQVYGDATPEAFRRLREEGFASILVHSVVNDASLASLDDLLSLCGEARPGHILFDANVPGQLGGTGRQAAWDVIARARPLYRRWPPVLLAGGLTPDNVAEAIKRLSPAGVDVSSGVESTPGRKDHKKIDAFIKAAREAWRL